MTSEVQICNISLQKVGSKHIATLTENSEAAKACNLCYADVRDREIRKYRWNFAKTRVQLAANATSPAFGKDNAYDLPSDCLRVLPGKTNLDWEIEGRQILTDDDAPIDVIYMKRVTDPQQFDVNFQNVLATAIALQIVEKITQSNTKKASLAQEYKIVVASAKSANSIESLPMESPEDEWISARR